MDTSHTSGHDPRRDNGPAHPASQPTKLPIIDHALPCVCVSDRADQTRPGAVVRLLRSIGCMVDRRFGVSTHCACRPAARSSLSHRRVKAVETVKGDAHQFFLALLPGAGTASTAGRGPVPGRLQTGCGVGRAGRNGTKRPRDGYIQVSRRYGEVRCRNASNAQPAAPRPCRPCMSFPISPPPHAAQSQMSHVESADRCDGSPTPPR